MLTRLGLFKSQNFVKVCKFSTVNIGGTNDVFTNKYKYELEIKSVLSKMNRIISMIP